jgi:hypothetical protein
MQNENGTFPRPIKPAKIVYPISGISPNWLSGLKILRALDA